jgi:peptide/nickel transport system substrate-binding protein
MMVMWKRLFAVAWALTLVTLIPGCGPAPSTPPKDAPQDGPAAPTASTDAKPAGGKVERFKQKFVPPKLDELNKSVEWVAQSVVDARKLLADELAANPPTISVEDALKLKNTDVESNAKILSGLGRLPEKDADMDENHVFNRHIPADIKSTNPVLTSSVYEAYVNTLTGIGFFSFDWNLKPFAASDTVVSWETSKDGLYDKVVIRDDLVWSDGKPITAHDVIFSYELIMTPEVPVPAVRSGMDKLKGVHAYDDHTVVYFHGESLVTNIWNLNFPILPKHVYESTMGDDPTLVTSPAHVAIEDNPVVGGPYKFVKRQKGQELVLERRDDYFMRNGKQVRDRPRFKTVRFRVLEDRNTALLALKNGDVEDYELQPNQWVTQTGDDEYYKLNTKVRGVEWTYYYFGWNMKTPFFKEKAVRQAMSYAVDYDDIIKNLTFNLYEQSTGEFHPAAWMAPKTPRTLYKQDLDKAEKLLDDAGWVDDDGDGIREKMVGGKKEKLEFEIMCAPDDLRVKICTSLKQSLENIGVRCTVRPTEFTVMQDKLQKHEYQAAFGGWGTGTDPDTTENLWKTNQERNYSAYSNKEVDALFEEGKKEFDHEKRADIYRKIDDILWDDQPYTWLYYRSGFFGFNKKLRGYKFSPRGPYSYSPGVDSIWAVP